MTGRSRRIERPKEGITSVQTAQVTGVRVRTGRNSEAERDVDSDAPSSGTLGPTRGRTRSGPIGPRTARPAPGPEGRMSTVSARSSADERSCGGAVGFCGSTQRHPSRLAGPGALELPPASHRPRSPGAELARKALGEIGTPAAASGGPVVDAMGPQRHAHLGPEPRQTARRAIESGPPLTATRTVAPGGSRHSLSSDRRTIVREGGDPRGGARSQRSRAATAFQADPGREGVESECTSRRELDGAVPCMAAGMVAGCRSLAHSASPADHGLDMAGVREHLERLGGGDLPPGSSEELHIVARASADRRRHR